MTTENTPSFNILPFKIIRMPIGSAFKWFNHGWILLKTQPWVQFITISWVLLSLSLLAFTLPNIPNIGIALAALILPVLSFGMADINQKIRLQEAVNPLDVFSGLHPNHRMRLLTIGACMALLLLISLTALSQFDLSPLTQFSEKVLNQAQALEPTELIKKFEEAQHDPKFVNAVITVDLFVLLNILIVVIFSYAPLFVVWQNVQPIPAIGLSLLTIWRNILPLILLSVLIVCTKLLVYLTLIFIVLIVPQLGLWFAFPILFLFIAFLFTLVFTSYHSIITTSLKKTTSTTLDSYI